MMNEKVNKIIIYVLTSVISVVVLIYIYIQIFSGGNNSIKTSPATLINEKEISTLDVYIIRKEELIYSTVDGFASLNYNDGDKVAYGDSIATIYYDVADPNVGNKLLELDEKISILNNSSYASDSVTSDTATLDNKINVLLSNLTTRANNGDLSYAMSHKNNLISYINRKEIMTEKSLNFSSQLAAFIAERDQLITNNNVKMASLYSSASGYFFNKVDGYENSFSSINIDTLSINSFQWVVSSPPDYNVLNSNNMIAFGKVSPDYYWYVAADIPYNESHNYTVGKNYDIIFSESGNVEASSVLYRAITQPDSDRCILIFKCGNYLDGFNYLRHQTVQVVSQTYSGYRVPVTAVHVVDGVKGVYVLVGSEVKFREIYPIYEKSGYLIVEKKDNADIKQRKRLDVNENIIVDNNDYYDGMLIE